MKMPTYFVMCSGYAYIKADNPKEAERIAEEETDVKMWDLQNFTSQDESEEDRLEREKVERQKTKMTT